MSEIRDVAWWCERIFLSGEVCFPTSIAHVGHDPASMEVGMGLAAAAASWQPARTPEGVAPRTWAAGLPPSAADLNAAAQAHSSSGGVANG